MAVMRPDLIMKSVIPVVMAGIIGIYGLVVSVVIVNSSKWSTSGTLCVHAYSYTVHTTETEVIEWRDVGVM